MVQVTSQKSCGRAIVTCASPPYVQMSFIYGICCYSSVATSSQHSAKLKPLKKGATADAADGQCGVDMVPWRAHAQTVDAQSFCRRPCITDQTDTLSEFVKVYFELVCVRAKLRRFVSAQVWCIII